MISIIIPTFNEEAIIESTLSRLKAGLTISHEIIVSDGDSKDKTAEIAKKYADHVIVYNGTERQNISQGRNAGAAITKGEFLVFLDADCTIFDPDAFFSSALSHFQKNQKLVGLVVYVRVLPEYETLADKIVSSIVNSSVRFQNNFLHKGDAPGGELQMVRKEAFLKIGGYNEGLITREDRDLFFRLSKIGETLSDPKLFVFHTGRRAHKVGWPRLIGLFLWNTLFFHIFGRVYSKEWKPIR